MRLHYVNDGVPTETTALLSAAAAQRGVEFVEVHAPSFDFGEERRADRGDLLYRAAVSVAARRVEYFLHADGVATFYSDPGGPLFGPPGDPIVHERAGIPVPRTIPCATRDRALLDDFVERLGGFPVVVKLHGHSGGLGVMLAESRAGLYSLVDHLVSEGRNPVLCAFVGDAVHWRVVVVGETAVVAYRNTTGPGDFRTYAASDPADYLASVPAPIAEVAVRAVSALRFEMGGVDLLEHPSGRLYVLEANFPCYFPQAQLVAGIDIAGAMLDHLVAKARRLA